MKWKQTKDIYPFRNVSPEERKYQHDFYEPLQSIYDKVNKNDDTLMLGDMNVWIENNEIKEIMETNGESTVNNNRRKLTDFCVFNKHKNIEEFL
jgi:exonuclease III